MNAAHKAKRVESVNADAQVFAEHWKSSGCSMKRRDRGHQSVSLPKKTEYSTVIKKNLDDHEGKEHHRVKGTGRRSVSLLPKSQEKIGDSAKAVIKKTGREESINMALLAINVRRQGWWMMKLVTEMSCMKF